MRFLAAVMLLTVSAVSSSAGDYAYEAADFQDPARMAGKLTDHNLGKLEKWKAGKIVLVEFAGEFLQSKEVTSSVFSQRATGQVTTKTSTIQLGGDYYDSVINRFYDMVKAAFEENGYPIVPRDNLASLERYKSLELDMEKTTKGYKGSAFSDGVSTKGLKISAEGLGLFPTNPLKAIKLAVRLAELTHDAEAGSAMRVSFYVDKGKKGAPVLKSMDIVLYADMEANEVGFAGNKKMSYGFKRQNETIFKLSKPMVNKVDISGPEKGSVDMEKYDQGLMALLGAAVDMLKADLKEAKKD